MPVRSENRAENRQRLMEIMEVVRRHELVKGMTPEKAEATMKDTMFFGAMMLYDDKVDGMVAGAICTTAATLRPGLQIIKMAPGMNTVSSCFIMELPNKAYGDDGVMIFADCAVNIVPTAEQLASIAVASAETGKVLCGIDPRVAMLSFSTKGSAKHDNVTKVQEATAKVHEIAPELNVDGELQAVIWMAALSALLCACSAQTVWETVDGGCVPAEGGAAYAIRIALPQDAVEEVFAERGARQIYTQPGGGYEITTEILDAAPAAAIVRRLSGFDASALHVYKSGGKDRPVWQFAWYAASDEGGRMYRCKVISDGSYCYALTVSVPEGVGTSYDTMLTEVFSSMELQPV